jgi:hypothetical protein
VSDGPISDAVKVALDAKRKADVVWSYRSTYDDSLRLLSLVELRLAKLTDKSPSALYRAIKVPGWLMIRGLVSILSDSTYMLILLAMQVALFWLGVTYLPTSTHAAIFILFSFTLFATVLTTFFPPPSKYCSSGINDKHVATVADQFAQWDERSAKRVELIGKNTKLFEERTRQRLTIFTWVLTATWAVLSPFGGELVKAATATPPRLVDIGQFGWWLAGLAAAFVTVNAYARGMDIVYRSIELGCNDRIAQIDRFEREGVYEKK